MCYMDSPQQSVWRCDRCSCSRDRDQPQHQLHLHHPPGQHFKITPTLTTTAGNEGSRSLKFYTHGDGPYGPYCISTFKQYLHNIYTVSRIFTSRESLANCSWCLQQQRRWDFPSASRQLCWADLWWEYLCTPSSLQLTAVSRVVIIVIMPVFSCDRLMIDTSLT